MGKRMKINLLAAIMVLAAGANMSFASSPKPPVTTLLASCHSGSASCTCDAGQACWYGGGGCQCRPQ